MENSYENIMDFHGFAMKNPWVSMKNPWVSIKNPQNLNSNSEGGVPRDD